MEHLTSKQNGGHFHLIHLIEKEEFQLLFNHQLNTILKKKSEFHDFSMTQTNFLIPWLSQAWNANFIFDVLSMTVWTP